MGVDNGAVNLRLAAVCGEHGAEGFVVFSSVKFEFYFSKRVDPGEVWAVAVGGGEVAAGWAISRGGMKSFGVVCSCGLTTKNMVLVDVVPLNWGTPFKQGGAVNAGIEWLLCTGVARVIIRITRC